MSGRFFMLFLNSYIEICTSIGFTSHTKNDVDSCTAFIRYSKPYHYHRNATNQKNAMLQLNKQEQGKALGLSTCARKPNHKEQP